MNGVRLRHVTSVSALGPGTWFFDYAGSRILIGEDPTGRLVETSVGTFAFYGSSSNVTIRGLTIEKYANPAQHGAIHAKDGTIGPSGTGWVIEKTEVRWNHGAGIAIGPGMRVRDSKVNYNGEIGITGEFQRVVGGVAIENTEIAYNNQAGFQGGWEAGGTKFLNTTDLVLRGNYVHHNFGPGLWSDTDNIRTTYDSNIIEYNGGIGLFHEVSYDAVIKNNTIRRNGTGWDVWLWGAQVLVAASPNVEIYGNTVEIAERGGDGICLIQQNRGSGKYGPYLILNNRIHDNVITFTGLAGTTGAGADYSAGTLFGGTNVFQKNTYRVADPSYPYFQWAGGTTDFKGMTSQRQESGSTISGLGAAPLVISNLVATPSNTGQATFTWNANRPATGQVFYSIGTSLNLASAVSATLSTSITATLSGLQNSTTYTYQVKSVDSQGIVALSAPATLSVPAAPAATATPSGTVSAVQLSGLISSSGDGSLWQLTCSSDGRQFTAMSDALGWQNATRLGVGAAIAPSDPAATSGQNIKFPNSSSGNWIGQGMIAVDGILYYAVSYLNKSRMPYQFSGSLIAYSADGGNSWLRRNASGVVSSLDLNAVPASTNMMFWNEPALAFSQPSFLQRGCGDSAAPDNYVYIYAPDSSRMENLNLARVPKDRLLDRSAWEYFLSRNPDGTAAWTSTIAARGYVHNFPANWVSGDFPLSWHPSVAYNPMLKKYVMTAAGTGRNGSALLSQPTALSILVADKPWGPWSQVYFSDAWKMSSTSDRLFEPVFAPKWTSVDGRSMYMVLSGTGTLMKFNVIRVDLLP